MHFFDAWAVAPWVRGGLYPTWGVAGGLRKGVVGIHYAQHGLRCGIVEIMKLEFAIILFLKVPRATFVPQLSQFAEATDKA